MTWLIDTNVISETARNVRHFPFCQTENPFQSKDPTAEPAK
jgi:hypothetical protein